MISVNEIHQMKLSSALCHIFYLKVNHSRKRYFNGDFNKQSPVRTIGVHVITNY